MTTEVVPFPDAEWIATRWLRDRLAATVTTDLVGWREGDTRVVVTRTGGVPKLAYRIDYPRLDVDCYGPGKADAHDLAQLARARLHDLAHTVHPEAVVAHVEDDAGLAWIPDPSTQAARYTFSVRLVIRPIP